MDYGKILRRAGQIAWQHKVLWLFGFLATLFVRSPSDIRYEMLPTELQYRLGDFVTSPNFLLFLAGVIAFSVLVGLGISILKALGRAALVDLVNRAEENETPSASLGWRAARRYGWRVFWIAFLLGLPVLVILLVGLAPIFATLFSFLLGLSTIGVKSSPGADLLGQTLLCFIPFCCLGVLLGAFLGIINTLAERACVLQDLSIWQSIKDGWQMLRENAGQIIVFWLIMAAFHLGIGLLVFMPSIAVMIPLMAVLFRGAESAQNLYPAVFIGGYLCISAILWIFISAISSVTEPFFSGSWTLLYRQLSADEHINEDIPADNLAGTDVEPV